MSDRPRHIPFEESLTKAERKEVKKLSRRSKKYMALLAIGLVGPANPVYWSDVMGNYNELQNAKLSITVEAPPLDPDNSDTALVFLHGFNTYDAVQLVETIGPAYQEITDGEMWSVRYGNADFAEELIAEEIIELAEERDIKEVVIVGYSAGGTIGSGVERNVYTGSALGVKANFPTHSPANQSSLRPYQQSELEVGRFATSMLPGSKHSKAWRWVFEMYFMRDRYLNPKKDLLGNIQVLGKTAAFATRIINRKNLPSVETLYQQINAIDKADVLGDAEAIAAHSQATGKPLPVHGYVEITEPGYDYVVNNKKAAEAYREAAEASGIPFFTIDVPTAVHSRPDINTDDYRTALLKKKSELLQAMNGTRTAHHEPDAIASGGQNFLYVVGQSDVSLSHDVSPETRAQ